MIVYFIYYLQYEHYELRIYSMYEYIVLKRSRMYSMYNFSYVFLHI